jgi:hypothetical protein
MKNYIFKVGVKNDVEVRAYNIIKETDMEYIKYNKFLKKEYFTNVEENDDYIPMATKNEAIIVLREDQFLPTEIESVFNMLYDNLYIDEGGNYEKSINY